MSLLQKNHAVLLKSLWKRTCAVNRTLDFFHPPSTLQSQTDFFSFRLLLYTVEVTATQSRKSKSIRHLRKQPSIAHIFWALHRLTVVAFACVSRHGGSSWASYGRDSQEETPPHNVPEPRGRLTHSLHRAHWDYAQYGGSWFGCVRALLPSSLRRGWRARDSAESCAPRCQKARGLHSSWLVSNLAGRKRSPK